MIKTAVIMAAGTGSRFGHHTQMKPKGFVCVGDMPMIKRSIENLLLAGIERIIIGTGYQHSSYDELAKEYPQIVCCKSDKYAETNSMYTLYLCGDLIGADDFLLLESDLIYEVKALTLLMNSDHENVMLVTPFTKQQDGYYLFADDEGLFSDCTTDADKRMHCKGELVGIHKLSNGAYKKMHDWYAAIWQQRPKLGYEYALLEMSRQGEKIYVVREENLLWYEIDDEADLLYAEKNIMPRMEMNMNKIVYLGMTADIIHPGLVNIIREAGKYGDVLIGLLTDEAIAEHKRLPHMNYNQRKEVVENIKGVAKVVPQKEWSYVNNLQEYKPDYIIHGDDWKQGPLAKIREDVLKVMKELGGEVIEIPYTQGITSSFLNKNIISVGTTPDIRLKILRRLLAVKDIVRVLEAHSGLSGLIIENVEVMKNDKRLAFDAMWSSSLTDSTCKGKPDIEAVDLTTRLQDLNNILECTTKPIIFDGDTGGKLEHFVFTVRTLERHGISAVIIEDKIGLKKNSLFGTDVIQTQDSIEDFCAKIKAGKNAQITDEFMIIARIESLIAGQPVSDALQRGHAYVQAGADGVMIHSKHKTGEDIKEFCLKFRADDKTTPIVVVPTTYHHITEDELKQWGVNIVIYANHMLRASYPAMLKAATTILEHQRASEADKLCMPINEILELIPGTK